MNKYTPTFVFLIFCLVIVLINMGCSSVTSTTNKVPIARVPTKITSYPLRDYNGVEHKYRDDFDSFVFPRDNKKLTQYCAFHYQWEDIKVVYSRNKNGEWGYDYIITTNKKSWK